jgi:hypothetical protein
MKAKSLFDFARMESFQMEWTEFGSPGREGASPFKVHGSATEAANTETVQQVMSEARLVLTGRREFRALLRALRG